MRLIDKDAYEKRMQEVYCKPCEADKKDHYGVACRACWVDDAIASVETMTEVDAEPVVRCKDCSRNADNGGLYDDGRTKCPIQEHYALLIDGYCHLGERMEGAEHE